MTRRWPVFVVIALVLVGLAVAEHKQSHPAPVDAVATRSLMPVASTPGTVSTSFFCAGGTANAAGGFDSTVVIANPNPTPITTTVTVFPAALESDTAGTAAVSTMKPVAKQVAVGPRTRTDVHLADLQSSPFAAALVDTNDPNVAVEHRITGKNGFSSSPCASSPSPRWFVPTGSTTKDARELLAVFNPFAADAVVDVTFQTSDGFRSPDSLQGVPVPGGHLRVVDVSAEVPRVEQLAAFVSARSGQVVVDRLQGFDGTDPNHPAGVAATLGAPQPASVWTFPQGAVDDGVRETITVMNPGDAPAQAQLEVVLDDPDTNGVVDPIPVTVPPRGYVQVAMQDQTRVPKSIGHTVTVRSLNGPGVVAERVITSVAPAPRTSYAPALGAPLRATQWLFADGAAVTGTSDVTLVVFNPSSAATHVSVTALAQGQPLAVDGLQNVEVPAGGRLALDLAPHVNRPDVPLLVTTTSPTAIERGYVNTTGTSFASGMPLPATASVPG